MGKDGSVCLHLRSSAKVLTLAGYFGWKIRKSRANSSPTVSVQVDKCDESRNEGLRWLKCFLRSDVLLSPRASLYPTKRLAEAVSVHVRKKPLWCVLRSLSGSYPVTSFTGSNAHDWKQVQGKGQCSGARRLRRICVALHQTLAQPEPCILPRCSAAPPLSKTFGAYTTKTTPIRTRTSELTVVTSGKSCFLETQNNSLISAFTLP